jgi:hypothetical protein
MAALTIITTIMILTQAAKLITAASKTAPSADARLVRNDFHAVVSGDHTHEATKTSFKGLMVRELWLD